MAASEVQKAALRMPCRKHDTLPGSSHLHQPCILLTACAPGLNRHACTATTYQELRLESFCAPSGTKAGAATPGVDGTTDAIELTPAACSEAALSAALSSAFLAFEPSASVSVSPAPIRSPIIRLPGNDRAYHCLVAAQQAASPGRYFTGSVLFRRGWHMTYGPAHRRASFLRWLCETAHL